MGRGMFDRREGALAAQEVADALNCAVCKPQPEPIEMSELY